VLLYNIRTGKDRSSEFLQDKAGVTATSVNVVANEPVKEQVRAAGIPIPRVHSEARSLCVSASKWENCQSELLEQRAMDFARLYEATGETAMNTSVPDIYAFEDATPMSPDRFKECSELVHAIPSVAPLWRAAAEKGSVSAMLNYAAGDAFNPDFILQNLDEYRIYQKRAGEYAYRAAREGSFTAVVALASAMSPHADMGFRRLLSQVLGTNKVESMTLYRMADHAMGVDVKGKERVKDLVRTRLLQLEVISSPEEIRQSVKESQRRTAEWQPLTVPARIDSLEALLLGGGQAPSPTEADCNSF